MPEQLTLARPFRWMTLCRPWLAALTSAIALSIPVQALAQSVDERVERLLGQMTLEEKVGQLTQYSSDWRATGPVRFNGTLREDIQSGKVGSMLNVVGVEYTRRFQEEAMKSRLNIPLLFGQDVVHGYKTTFPIPLAEAASWDLSAMERSARIAATEAAAAGLHWTFAPMVDIARDPRWGRVMEGAGEDPYLGARIATARVKGFQGEKLGDLDAVMATAKHFAAYGAAVAGRDYNSVDMSERQLWDVYLPPFKAAVQAGVATFMNSFNDLNGVPATGNRYLQRDILKGQWKFQGFVVSDWGSIGELVEHGYAKDLSDAAQKALSAGNDMDMESEAYRKHARTLLDQGKLQMAQMDDAVRRILRKKFELGLFEDPFRFSDPKRAQQVLNLPEHAQAARDMARKSIVLLKNDQNVLPLSPSVRTVAFIGPLVKAVKDNMGSWAVNLPDVDYNQLVVTQWDGLRNHLGTDTRLLYAKGCEIDSPSREGFAQALDVAHQADVIVVSVGESANMSGEARSRTHLRIPGVQEDLVQALRATGKPLVVLVNAGRPLLLDRLTQDATALVYTWWLGTQAGNAIADVLVGDYNPSAKLPITFPRNLGQIPIYYNALNTGRPAASDDEKGYHSTYLDSLLSPQYPFGFGLSYTTFGYTDLQLDRRAFKVGERVNVSVRVTNTGKVDGEEIVQLYLRARVASLVRPVKELKDFQKVSLKAGESRTLQFSIDADKLAYFNAQRQWGAEPGEFDLMIGASSADIRLRDKFTLLP